MQNFHNVEVLTFQENSFALQVAVYVLFLLFYRLALAVYFLKENLHEVYLAQSQLAHLFDNLGLLTSLDGRFEALKNAFGRGDRGEASLLAPCE